ncbi:hypothetical protein OROGR_012168 [Orobanche gracilis]
MPFQDITGGRYYVKDAILSRILSDVLRRGNHCVRIVIGRSMLVRTQVSCIPGYP